MFIIRIMKFYKGVSRDIISGWIWDKIKLIRIYVFNFSLYLIRVVLVRLVYNESVFIDIVMEKVGWLNISIF